VAKGATPIGRAVNIIICLTVLVIVLLGFRAWTSSPTQIFTSASLKASQEACVALHQNPTWLQDKDKDGVYDACDLCVFESLDSEGKPIIIDGKPVYLGNNNKDDDGDFLPDDCDTPGTKGEPKCNKEKNLVRDKSVNCCLSRAAFTPPIILA